MWSIKAVDKRSSQFKKKKKNKNVSSVDDDNDRIYKYVTDHQGDGNGNNDQSIAHLVSFSLPDNIWSIFWDSNYFLATRPYLSPSTSVCFSKSMISQLDKDFLFS